MTAYSKAKFVPTKKVFSFHSVFMKNPHGFRYRGDEVSSPAIRNHPRRCMGDGTHANIRADNRIRPRTRPKYAGPPTRAAPAGFAAPVAYVRLEKL